MLTHGIPEHIRSDNGPEMVAKQLRNWLGRLGDFHSNGGNEGHEHHSREWDPMPLIVRAAGSTSPAWFSPTG